MNRIFIHLVTPIVKFESKIKQYALLLSQIPLEG